MNNAGDSRNGEAQDSGGEVPPSQPMEGSTNDGNQRATRNITVSIQYSYFTPHRFANLNNNNNNNGDQEVPANDPNVTLPGLGFPTAGNENNGGRSGGESTEGGNNADPAAANAANATNATNAANATNAPRPDGALVLSFRDVPVSTPQERLESIISIAAELAMRRFSDIMSIPKGITREQFERLPVLRVSSLPEKQDATCSICYENYEDEPSTPLKRARDGEDMEDEGDLDSVKKKRSESPGSLETMETAPSYPLEHRDTQVGESHGREEQSSENLPAQQQEVPPPLQQPPQQEPEAPQTEAPQQNASQQGEEAQRKYLHSPVQLPCSHVFGRECLDKWAQIENSCPLCRRKIVEAQPPQRPEPGNAPGATNMEAFERIRQLLYNSPGEQQGQQQQNGEGTAEGLSATGELDPQSFTVSRSGIVFLRPGQQPGGENANQPGNASENQPDGAGNQTANDAPNGRDAETTPNTNNNNLNLFGGDLNARRIHWMPLPLTSIHTDNGLEDREGQGQHDRLVSILDHIFNAARNDSNNNNNEDGNSNENNNQENVNANNSSGINRGELPPGPGFVTLPLIRPPVATIPGPASFARAATPVQAPTEAAGENSASPTLATEGTEGTETNNTASSGPASAPASTSALGSDSLAQSPPTPSRRRSFLDNILRITNLNRTFGRSRNSNRSNDSNNNTTGSTSDSDSQSHRNRNNNMFNSGVASYRNQNGRVSTFQIQNVPLPIPFLLRRRQGTSRGDESHDSNTTSNDNGSNNTESGSAPSRDNQEASQ